MDLPRSTRSHRAHGRPTRTTRYASQQYLTQEEEAVLRAFITAEATKAPGFRFKQTELLKVAGLIRYRRHSTKKLCEKDLESCNVPLPTKNWGPSFFARFGEGPKCSKNPNLAKRGPNNMAELMEGLDPKIQRTKILHENIYHLQVVGGVLVEDLKLRRLVTGGDIADYMGRTQAGKVLTVVECISLHERALRPFIVWPATTSVISRTPARPTFDHCITSSRTGEFDTIAFSDWLQRVFDHQTRNQNEGRLRFLIVDRLADYRSDHIINFCQSRKIVICETKGSLARCLPSNTVSITEAWASVIVALREAYNEKESLGMDFWERYGDARREAFGGHEGGTVDPGIAQMEISLSVNAQPADSSGGETLVPAHASTTVDRSLDSLPERQILSPARFEYLVHRVEHDMACIDMDEAVRNRLNDLISSSKAFASVVHISELDGRT